MKSSNMSAQWILFGGFCLIASVATYRPVVIVHGILDGPKQFRNLMNFIVQSHPGTNVTTIDLYNNWKSFKPLWKQVEGFKRAMSPILQNAKDGVDLICFSQGGLICHGLVATVPSHNVHSLIFLSSPLAGQYGATNYMKYLFPHLLKANIYRVCYTSWGQKRSICNYWNDPHHKEKYLRHNNYLPLLNGEKEHANMTEWKENFLQIKKVVLIGGPQDDVITPWQSSLFGFYDQNETVVGMRNQDWYLRDTFGLKTLDAKGDLVQCVVPGIRHTSWHSDHTVFKVCIEKWLG